MKYFRFVLLIYFVFILISSCVLADSLSLQSQIQDSSTTKDISSGSKIPYLDYLVIIISLIIAIGTWVINEIFKRKWEEYRRKEERYRILLETSRGFYSEKEKDELKIAFINQVGLCWLYCPDKVIKKANDFLQKSSTDSNNSPEDVTKAFQEFILVIRNDLLERKIVKNTSLSSDEFMIYSPSKKAK